MKRRQFITRVGTVGVASLASVTLNAAPGIAPHDMKRFQQGNWFDPSRTLHFFDLWCLDHCDKLQLQQGRPEWQESATYVEPHIGNLAGWPTVFRDTETGRWRMLYSASWKPFALMVAESDDGREWHPAPQPRIQPADGKRAAHHVFTLPGGSGGAVYLDPIAADGFPFKVFVHQQGAEIGRRALSDPEHRWHEVARDDGLQKRYLNEEFLLVSQDGLHWMERRDLSWSTPDWHPEPPIFGFYNRHRNQHAMTVRPGWGDRRQCLQTTNDFQSWSGPEFLLQPDALDDELIEIYGMPVFPYGDGYIGLPWIFHCDSSEPTRGFNRFVGSLDCQLAYSRDGSHFVRGLREPFVATNENGEHGGGAIQPSCVVETDDELRIYSAGSKVLHGMGRDARKRGFQSASILLHTLRKDGLMCLRTSGSTGRMITKPIVLLEPKLEINASTPQGSLHYQLTDLESRPVEGFTFDDCEAMSATDALSFPLRWKNRDLSDIVGRIVRLEARLIHAELFALRGHFHFIDAQDKWMIEDKRPIPV